MNGDLERSNYVISRLEHLFSPFSSEIKRKKLTKIIGFHLNQFLQNPSLINKLSPYIQIGGENVILPENSEETQATLAGLFFALNRSQYDEKVFDKEKEGRQIEAVAAFLSGFHLQMGTGEGKSTTVFPIVALVEALTNQKKSAVLATSDESNLADLRSGVENLINLAKKHEIDLTAISIKQKENKQTQLDPNIQKNMVAETSIEGKYSSETEKSIKRQYWEKALGQEDGDYDFLYKKRGEIKPSIILTTDRDLVFGFAENQKKFIDNIPEIYMDEADIPYNRRTPYKQTAPAFYFSPQEIQETTTHWLIDYLIWHQLKPTDFQPGKKGYELPDVKLNKIRKLRLSELIKNRPNLFNKAALIIANKLGLTPDQIIYLKEKLSQSIIDIETSASQTMIQSVDDQSLESVKEVNYEEIARRLANFYKKSGVFYKSSKSETGIQVRDQYIDQVLEDHHFTPDDQLAILAIEGKFDFVQLDQATKKTLTFQTFINSIKDKFHGASGTLKFPDPDLKKVVDTNFSRFLSEATGRKVFDVTQPEIKDLPAPKILDTDEETIEELVKEVNIHQDKQPTLVISYDIQSSEKIYYQLRKTLGKKVGYIETKPSDPEKVKSYNSIVKKLYQQLADGEIDVLVSSGASGFAVNIVKSDKSYPDLHIVLHNLPANRQLLMQNLSRRRLKGSSFSWFISKEYLDLYMMLFEEKVDVLSHALGELDILEIKERLEKIKDEPDMALPLILEILRKAEIYEAANDEFLILYDDMIENINKIIEKRIKKRLFFQEGDRDKVMAYIDNPARINLVFANFLQRIGLPARLYEDINSYLSLIPNTGKDLRSWMAEVYSALVYGDKQQIISELTSDWYEKRFEIANQFANTTDKGVTVLDHVLTNQIDFKPLPMDVFDMKTKNHWGQVEIQGQNYLAYQTPENEIYLIYVYDGKKNRPLPSYYFYRFNNENTIHGFGQKKSAVLIDIF